MSRKRGADENESSVLFQLSGLLAEQARKIESMAKRQCDDEAPKSDSIEDIMARASKLQRSLKRPGPADSDYGSSSSTSNSCSSSRRRRKPGPTVDDFVAITVCEMKVKRGGGYQRCKDHQLEITTARRSDSYESFALKAASALNLKPPSTFQNLCLFKAIGGIKISDADIVISDTSRPWSLGNYLALLKKNPSNVQIGVSYVSASDESEYSSNDSEADDEPEGPRLENEPERPTLENSPRKSVVISSDNSDENSQSNTSMSLPKYKVDPWVSTKHTLAIGVQRFEEQTLLKATDNFSEETKLGEGGFGVVHKGLLFGSYVAVKRLSVAGTRAIIKTEETAKENNLMDQLYTEISALSRCRHKNLVELMGFCLKPPILIYEFMEKGSLHSLLHKETPPLTWFQRSKCIKDVCRGLVWLHKANPPMRHGDLKATNVLVDGQFTAKIGDFGFTQEMPIMLSHTVALRTANHVVKSVGYSAPELDLYRHSVKSDVYSYGVLVLETYTGLPPFDTKEEDILLTDRVQQNLTNVQVFQEISCTRIEPPPEHLTHIYFNIIKDTLQKHSIRPQSDKVMELWDYTDF